MKILFFLILMLNSCNILSAQENLLFYLQPYCGQSYGGKVVFPADDQDPFAGKKLVIHFEFCDPQEIRVPFTVGEDRSRTWILTKTNEGLLLKHDHRHEDGTPDEVTLYGGFDRQMNNPRIAVFSADDYTAALIPAAANNEWTIALQKGDQKLSYILKRDGTLRFQADFDLIHPLRE